MIVFIDFDYEHKSRYFQNLNKIINSFGWLVSKQRSQLWVDAADVVDRTVSYSYSRLPWTSTLYWPRNILQSLRTDKLLSIRWNDIRKCRPHYTLDCLLVLELATPYTIEMMLRKRCVGGKIGIVMTADQILTELLSRRHIAFPILCSTACPPLSNGINVTKNIEVDE